MRAHWRLLGLACCSCLALCVLGYPLRKGRTAHVQTPDDFLLCFSPEWVDTIETVVVENHLCFDAMDYTAFSVNKTKMLGRAGGVSEPPEMWELKVPDDFPVLTFTGSTIFQVIGLRILGVEHGIWFGDEAGLWRVEGDAQIEYRSCVILLDGPVFATMSFVHLSNWKVSDKSIHVEKEQLERFLFVDVTFSKQEVARGPQPDMVEVRDPDDVTWLQWMQEETSTKLEVHLHLDMVIDACVVTRAMGGKRGPIPVRRPVVIMGSNAILRFSSDILPDGFLSVDRQPLVIEETTIDLQDVDVWPGADEDCMGWACSNTNATIILPPDQEDCIFSVFESDIVMPRGFLEDPHLDDWMTRGSLYTANSANVEIYANNTGDGVLITEFTYLGRCLVQSPIRRDLPREFVDVGVYCTDDQNPKKNRRTLGTVKIGIMSALGFGIVAFAFCLAAVCAVGGNKMKSPEKLGQKIKFRFQTSSSSEGLPDSIVVSPDPEMGTYAPHIDMDFKLVLDQAPLWILEEIFNQSNYDQDSSIVLEERIASGGYGVVFKGTWKGIPVAIKTVLFQDMGHKELQENKEKARAIVEAAISSSVAHPNIVQTYAFSFKRVSKRPVEETDQDSERSGMDSRKQKHCPRRTHWKLYMVQELCNAGSLNAALAKQAFMDSANNPCLSYILQIALDVGRGVMHLHRHNIIHGDLSARNILLQKRAIQKDCVKLTAKIADFGLSRKMEKCQNHIADHWAGTPFYMAPEVVQSGHLSKAADVFSFGVVMWELYHSRECFQEKEDMSVESDDRFQYHPLFPKFPTSCPLPLVMLCVSCLSPDPDDRPSFRLICKALSALQTREKKGHYSSPGSIQASNKETSQAMGRMNSNQIVDIVTMLLAIDSQRSVRSRSMEIAQAPATGVNMPGVAFYWPTEIQVSLNQAVTANCANITSHSKDVENDSAPSVFSAFNYHETDGKHAKVTKSFVSEASKSSTQPTDSSCEVGVCVDDLDDGLAPWSVDADDLDDAEKGLSSSNAEIEADDQSSSRMGIGITVWQRVRNRCPQSRNSSRRERQWEMDGGVLTGLEPISKTADDISSLPYMTVLPALREELPPEGQEVHRDNLRSMERIPCASDIFLSVSGEV